MVENYLHPNRNEASLVHTVLPDPEGPIINMLPFEKFNTRDILLIWSTALSNKTKFMFCISLFSELKSSKFSFMIPFKTDKLSTASYFLLSTSAIGEYSKISGFILRMFEVVNGLSSNDFLPRSNNMFEF